MAAKNMDFTAVKPLAAYTFLLRCELRADGCVTGMLHPYYPKTAVCFAGLDHALLMMHRWIEECGPVPEGLSLRIFEGGCADWGTFSAPRYRRGGGPRETFLVSVFYRKNVSWQGEVYWRNRKVLFRSALELMSLIRSALSPADPEEGRSDPERGGPAGDRSE